MSKSQTILIDTSNAIENPAKPSTTIASTESLLDGIKSNYNDNQQHYHDNIQQKQEQQKSFDETKTTSPKQTAKPLDEQKQNHYISNEEHSNSNNDVNAIHNDDSVDVDINENAPNTELHDNDGSGSDKNHYHNGIDAETSVNSLSKSIKSAYSSVKETLAHHQMPSNRLAVGTQAASASSSTNGIVTSATTITSSSKIWRIKHIQIETTLTIVCVFLLILVAFLVTFMIISSMKRRKFNKNCDKRKLIDSECDVDFSSSSSTTSILSHLTTPSSTTTMHV